MSLNTSFLCILVIIFIYFFIYLNKVFLECFIIKNIANYYILSFEYKKNDEKEDYKKFLDFIETKAKIIKKFEAPERFIDIDGGNIDFYSKSIENLIYSEKEHTVWVEIYKKLLNDEKFLKWLEYSTFLESCNDYNGRKVKENQQLGRFLKKYSTNKNDYNLRSKIVILSTVFLDYLELLDYSRKPKIKNYFDKKEIKSDPTKTINSDFENLFTEKVFINIYEKELYLIKKNINYVKKNDTNYLISTIKKSKYDKKTKKLIIELLKIFCDNEKLTYKEIMEIFMKKKNLNCNSIELMLIEYLFKEIIEFKEEIEFKKKLKKE